MAADPLWPRLAAAIEIAREAGRLAHAFLEDPARLEVAMKGRQDFVSAADKAAERLIGQRLSAAFPGDSFLGEEGEMRGPIDSNALWIVDPIDGTSNFVRHRPEWVVSIGFMTAGRPALGVIYQPTRDVLWCALAGHGATRNGAPIVVSAASSLAGSTIALESSLAPKGAEHAAVVDALRARGGEYRRYGSAALALCLLAEGLLDGFMEAHLNAWDVAAGIVIVREAGGWTCDFFADEGLERGNPMVAGAPGLLEEMGAMLRQALPGVAGLAP
jgi:myo-inositol-1(or 4)-monophosphatase